MKFAFAGSPDFAAWTLEDLVGLGRRPTLVISQPDRPVGRGRRAAAPAAAAAAGRLGLDLIQPEDINAPAVVEQVRTSGAAVLVVAAFGQILRRNLLDSVPCINIHASLLPAYRGAAPIERALAAGEECTGVSVMRVVEALDAGPWALKTSLSISLWDDAGTLARALAFLGARGVDQVLTGIEDGTVVWTEQDGESVYAEKLCQEDCFLNPACSARAVHDQVRALSPRVGARVACGGVRFKVWRTWPYGVLGMETPADAVPAVGRPGAIEATPTRLFLGCTEGVVEILSLQPDGRGRMTAAEFVRGYRGRLGASITPITGACFPEEGGG